MAEGPEAEEAAHTGEGEALEVKKTMRREIAHQRGARVRTHNTSTCQMTDAVDLCSYMVLLFTVLIVL